MKSYANVFISILCNRGVAAFKLFAKIVSNGFWSVSSTNLMAYRKWWNFSIAHETANASNSIAMYPFWESVSALLPKYTGCSHCSRQAPSPFALASVCSTVGFLGS